MKTINISFILRTILFAIIFFTPILIYILIFGSSLSTEHERWSQFGSFISGIYAPIISILTITILLKQLELQHKYNTHIEDQTHISSARDDLREASKRILDIINETSPESYTYRALLHRHFQPKTRKDLENSDLIKYARKLHHMTPSLSSSWGDVLSIMTGLYAPDSMPYKLVSVNETNKLISSLTMETCVALDNFYWALSKDKLKSTKYLFSPLLSDLQNMLGTKT